MRRLADMRDCEESFAELVLITVFEVIRVPVESQIYLNELV